MRQTISISGKLVLWLSAGALVIVSATTGLRHHFATQAMNRDLDAALAATTNRLGRTLAPAVAVGDSGSARDILLTEFSFESVVAAVVWRHGTSGAPELIGGLHRTDGVIRDLDHEPAGRRWISKSADIEQHAVDELDADAAGRVTVFMDVSPIRARLVTTTLAGAFRMLVASALLIALAGLLATRLLASLRTRESSLRDSERTYADIFDATHDAIIVYDAETGDVRYVNDRMLEMFRGTKELAYRSSLGVIMAGVEPHTSERAMEFIQRAQSDGPQLFEWRARRADGVLFWAEVGLRSTAIAGSPCVVATIWDTTNRKRTEDALRYLGETRSNAGGLSFFESTARHLAQTLEADCVLIGELQVPGSRSVRTLAVVLDHELEDGFEYALAGTPCADVIGRSSCAFESGIVDAFPDDAMLAEMEIEGYVGEVLLDAAGRPIGLIVALFRNPVEDVSFAQSILQVFASRVGSELERARADESLRNREADLERAQEVAHLGNYSWDLRTDAMTWSNEFKRILGCPDAEPSLSLILELVHPDDLERVAEVGRRARDEDEPFDVEYRIVRRDGTIRYVHDTARITRDDDGTPISMFGTTLDITERKQAAIALEASEERYRLVFNQQFQFTAILAPDGRVLEINDLPLRMTGLSRSDLVGRFFWESPTWANLDGWPAIIRQNVEEAASRDEPLLTEDLYQTPDGETRHLLASYTAIRGARGAVRFISAQAIDITDRKHAEQQSIFQMETQKLLISELDHRVRNNLSSLLSLIELSRSSANSVEDLASALSARARTIASVHSILAAADWHGGDLERMIVAIAQPNRRGSVHVDGPAILIPRGQAQALGLVINEFMTNSVKHGAMSVDTGHVDISWTTKAAEDGIIQVTLHWRESGGPRITTEPSSGTGTHLIEGLTGSELRGGAILTYPPEGASHMLHMSLYEDATAQFGRPTEAAIT